MKTKSCSHFKSWKVGERHKCKCKCRTAGEGRFVFSRFVWFQLRNRRLHGWEKAFPTDNSELWDESLFAKRYRRWTSFGQLIRYPGIRKSARFASEILEFNWHFCYGKFILFIYLLIISSMISKKEEKIIIKINYLIVNLVCYTKWFLNACAHFKYVRSIIWTHGLYNWRKCSMCLPYLFTMRLHALALNSTLAQKYQVFLE